MTAENLVILFSDVVGSTELSHLQSPEDADELRRRHFAILRQALTEADGTEVKNLGDGLMVIFGSASAALGCAVGHAAGRGTRQSRLLTPVRRAADRPRAAAKSSRRTMTIGVIR